MTGKEYLDSEREKAFRIYKANFPNDPEGNFKDFWLHWLEVTIVMDYNFKELKK